MSDEFDYQSLLRELNVYPVSLIKVYLVNFPFVGPTAEDTKTGEVPSANWTDSDLVDPTTFKQKSIQFICSSVEGAEGGNAPAIYDLYRTLSRIAGELDPDYDCYKPVDLRRYKNWSAFTLDGRGNQIVKGLIQPLDTTKPTYLIMESDNFHVMICLFLNRAFLVFYEPGYVNPEKTTEHLIMRTNSKLDMASEKKPTIFAPANVETLKSKI